MRTLSTAMALTLGVMAWAQTSPAAQEQQPTAPYVKSTYHDCLTMAGTNTWQAMGLNSDQMARLNDMQTRYKLAGQADAEAKAKAEEKAAKEARKSGKRKQANEPKAAAQSPNAVSGSTAAVRTTTPVPQTDKEPSAPMTKDRGTALEPATEGQATLEKGEPSMDADAAMSAQPVSSYDEELRAILTPEQMHLWERRCDVRTSMRP